MEAQSPLIGTAFAAVLDEDAVEDRVVRYWNARAEGFAETREAELGSDEAALWLAEILPVLRRYGSPRVLDIGTGTGFFPILLSKLGIRATGIDLAPEMVSEARKLALRHGFANHDFRVMNAEETEFEAGTFDVILTRNLTWTLPSLPRAYREWFRVLASGGTLLNFDADYGLVNFARLTGELEEEGVENAHEGLEAEELRACDEIKDSLPVSSMRRPEWDEVLLAESGFTSVETDLGLSDRVYPVRDSTWNPVPMFRIEARKPL